MLPLSHLIDHVKKDSISSSLYCAVPNDRKLWSVAETQILLQQAYDVQKKTDKVLIEALSSILPETIEKHTRLANELSPYIEQCVQDVGTEYSKITGDHAEIKIDYLKNVVRAQEKFIVMCANNYIANYQYLGRFMPLILAGQSIEMALSVLDCVTVAEDCPINPPVVPPGPVVVKDLIVEIRGFTMGDKVLEYMENYDHIIHGHQNKDFITYWEALKNMPYNKKSLSEVGYKGVSK